jgi:hypothetical protein
MPLAYELEVPTVELGEHNRRPLPRTLKILLGAVIAAAIGFGGFTAGLQGRPAHVAPPHPTPSAPARSAKVVAPPHPAPSASALQPATQLPVPGLPALSGDDERFLAMLKRDGIIVRPEVVPNAILSGTLICRMIARGDGYDTIEKACRAGGDTPQQAKVWVNDANAAYCPHAGMPG